MPTPEAIAAAKELHSENWHGMTYDQMIAVTAATIDRHFAKPDPECNTGDPAFIKDMRPTVEDATGLRPGPCLDLAKQLYNDGHTNLPDGLR